MRRAVLGCALALSMVGCVNRPAIVGSTTLWPFEQLSIRTSVGTLSGYLSQPEGAANRLVVAVQTSPCASTRSHANANDVIATNGIIWEQFRRDSAFFQLERPGRVDLNSMLIECNRMKRIADDDEWQRAIADSVRALRKDKDLRAVPTIYLGIGNGALPALRAAGGDDSSEAVVLLSAMLNDASFESRKLRTRVLFLHGAADARTPLQTVERFIGSMPAGDVQLQVFDEVGFDFGLTSDQSDCFDVVALRLARYVRSPQNEQQNATHVTCKSTPALDDHNDAIDVQRIERL